MKKFIILKSDNMMLDKCILDVIKEDNQTVTLSYNNFDDTKEIVIPLSDGEFYTEETRLRREKELAIRNVLSLMEYHNISLSDLQ